MKNSWTIILIIIAGFVVLLPFVGQTPLFDWDEVNFAEAAREMIVRHNFTQVTIDYQPFFEKPPLFFWLQAGSMMLFGINEFAARFPNVLFGVLSLIMLYTLGKKIKDHSFGLIWMMCFGASLLPFGYAQSGIIDPVFNFFIFTGVYSGFQSLMSKGVKQVKYAALAGLSIGLSVLTKGPAGIILSYLTLGIFWLINLKKIKFNILSVFALLLATLLFPLMWFGFETMANGKYFIYEFLKYQVRLFTTEDAGHGGPFYYHFVILLIGMFPASVLAFGAFRKGAEPDQTLISFRQINTILFLVVLILFSIVKTKIVHYSSLAYYPLSFLASVAVYRLIIDRNIKFSKWYGPGFLIIGLFISIAFSSVAFLMGSYKHVILPLLNDQFARESLNATVHWHIIDYLTGFFYFISIITSLILIYRYKNHTAGIILLFAATIFVTKTALISTMPKIEQYTQHAAIEFYKNKQHENCYIEVVGFKSYAQYFYTAKMPLTQNCFYKKDSLLTGNIDKTTYFVAKTGSAESFKNSFKLKELYSKNGYVFLKRDLK
jgi:4-amino-4-deoxy-L-arabinose transferase-like glycosyltransferase